MLRACVVSQGWGRPGRGGEGSSGPGIQRRRKTELSGGPEAHTRGPWVPVKPEWLSGLAEPSTLGGQQTRDTVFPETASGGDCPFLVQPASLPSSFHCQWMGLGWTCQQSCCLCEQAPCSSRVGVQHPMRARPAARHRDLPGWQRCLVAGSPGAWGKERSVSTPCTVKTGKGGRGLSWRDAWRGEQR